MVITSFQEPEIQDEKAKFKAYVEVQESGETNMFDAQAVSDLALEYCDVILVRTEIAYIMRNYNLLKEKYDY